MLCVNCECENLLDAKVTGIRTFPVVNPFFDSSGKFTSVILVYELILANNYLFL